VPLNRIGVLQMRGISRPQLGVKPLSLRLRAAENRLPDDSIPGMIKRRTGDERATMNDW